MTLLVNKTFFSVFWKIVSFNYLHSSGLFQDNISTAANIPKSFCITISRSATEKIKEALCKEVI